MECQPGSCMRCGNCCTRFGVCVTPSDMSRIAEATKKHPRSFVSTVPEPPLRERTEPAILIDGRRSLLVLKRDRGDVCAFYGAAAGGCAIYASRPMLCRTYPFRVRGSGSRATDPKLVSVSSRACPLPWVPRCAEGRKYLSDCKKYESEIRAYERTADEWNRKGGGTLSGFLDFSAEMARRAKKTPRL